MKGVILAGGMGTRLRPVTLATNKHLLPIYDRPMVAYPIQAMVRAGITELCIVTNGDQIGDFEAVLGDGADYGLTQLVFGKQDGAGGIADALAVAEPFVADDRMCVMLGDNIIEGNVADAAEAFAKQDAGAKLILKEVEHPERYGVVRFEGDRIAEIIEKPAAPPSQSIVTGIYFYTPDVFDVCRAIKPSARGELEITDVNNVYVQRGELTYHTLTGWWSDAGQFDSLLDVSNRVARGGANHGHLDGSPII